MPCVAYKPKRFEEQNTTIIEHANRLIAQYTAAGFSLTLRSLYYRFIAEDLFPDTWIDPVYNAKHNLPADTKNTEKNYKKLGVILNEARLAGLVDWNAIEDRTRNLVSPSTWGSPAEILQSAMNSYAIDKWVGQQYRPEVWVEKDAVIGNIEGVCAELQVPYFSCRGNTSQSEMWRAGMRLQRLMKKGCEPVIIHLGDHDPSGIDMTRDITERLEMFMGGVDINRIALNMDQIEQYNPPPNPAKTTDSRYKKYEELYGDDSWELDALEPQVMADLLRETILKLRDEDAWDERVAIEDEHRSRLEAMVERERKLTEDESENE